MIRPGCTRVCRGLWVALLVGVVHTVDAQVLEQVSLSVSKETAPPGGMAQIKVHITEPKPITTGSGYFSFAAYDSIDGIAIMNALEDVAAIALVRGTEMSFAFISPSGTFGLDSDYPVITVAGRIPDGTPIGTKYPFIIDASNLQLYDAAGVLYAVEAKAGHLITQPGLSIHDVNPGSATVPAGTVVTITGSGFTRGTEIRFKETKLSSVRYVSPNQIDVVVKSRTEMHGMAIRATNPDGSRSVYFSYQRTGPAGVSADPVLRYAVPLPSPHEAMGATVAFPAAAPDATYGVGVQNVQTSDAFVSFELVDVNGVVTAGPTLTVPSNRYIVRELSELFGFAPPVASTVRITSSGLVQVVGAVADRVNSTARPILPE
jgi:hypothetical protein